MSKISGLQDALDKAKERSIKNQTNTHVYMNVSDKSYKVTGELEYRGKRMGTFRNGIRVH